MKIFPCAFERICLIECYFNWFSNVFLKIILVKEKIILISVTVKISFFAIEYYISKSAKGSRRNKMSQGPLQETVSEADTTQSRF